MGHDTINRIKNKAEYKLQAFCELIQKPIREHVKIRYNASIKT